MEHAIGALRESWRAKAGPRDATRQARLGIGRSWLVGETLSCLRVTPRATPNDSALLHVLEATIETLKAENETLKRRLAAAETRAAQETAKAKWRSTERLDALGGQAPRPWRRLARAAFWIIAGRRLRQRLIWPGR